MAVTHEILVGLLTAHGGKMKKSDFVSQFKILLESDDPAERRRRRDRFKALVNQVACVKDQEGVRHVVLKKVLRPLLDERTAEEEEEEEYEVEQGGGGEEQQPQEEQQQLSNSRRDGEGAAPPAGPGEALPCDEKPGGATGVLSPVQQALRRSTFGKFKVRRSLNFDMQKNARKSNSINSEPDNPPDPRSRVKVHTVGPHPNTNTDPPGSPKLSSRSNNSSSRRPPAAAVAPSSVESALSSERSSENRVSSAFPLDPMEHQWLVQCAAGRWSHVLGLLMQDCQLAARRDFTSGFTALHWAAKSGDSRMLVTILDMARRGGVAVDVDARSHGGYTPLHVAVVHGQDYIVTMLVGECGADVGARDHSGRRAYHYLRSGAAASLRELLGQPTVPLREKIQQQEQLGEEPELLPLEHSRGRLHSISRLFQPHTVAHRRRHKQRPTMSSFSFTSQTEEAALCPAEEEQQLD